MSTYSNGSISVEGNERHLRRLGKPIVFTKVFKNNGETFSAFYAAQDWLTKNKIDSGSMERGNPIGLCRDADISKWSGLTNYGTLDDVKNLEGIMVCDQSFLEGDVAVHLIFKPENE